MDFLYPYLRDIYVYMENSPFEAGDNDLEGLTVEKAADDLDSEFERLFDEEPNHNEELEFEAALFLIKQAVCQRMDARGIVRVVDADPILESTLQENFINSIREAQTELFRLRPGGEELYAYDDHSSWVTIACVQILKRKIMIQAAVLHYLSVVSYEQKILSTGAESVIPPHSKKVIQSFLLIASDALDSDDQMLNEFFNDEMPGLGILIGDENDSKYIQMAQREYDATIARENAILAQTKVLARVDSMKGTPDEPHMILILTILMTHVLACLETARPGEVRDTIMSLGQKFGLDYEVAERLVHFYDAPPQVSE